MRRLRTILAILLSALMLLACRPAPMGLAPATTRQDLPLLSGQLVLPDDYATQANATQARSNATVTLIDPATFQAKGTGITAPDGTFTVQALSSFTPTLGTLYLLESTKTLGTNSSALFRLRTLVQLNAAGWTSVTGPAIQLSAETTAVSILWHQHGLSAPDVIGKVSYDATTRTHRFSDLNATVTESKLREVDALVNEALRLDLDPIQLVRPGPDGHYRLGLYDKSRNMLVNAGFEEGGTAVTAWYFFNPVSAGTYSIETGTVYEGSRSVRITANAAGDIWYGQGSFWFPTEANPLSLVAGRTYTLSVYARGSAGGERLAIGPSPVTLTTSWQRYSFTWTQATSTNLIILRPGSVAGQATFPATVYLDNVQLEEGSAATTHEPQGRLTLEGFANSQESLNVTPSDGRSGRGVVVDNGLNLISNSSFEQDSDADGIADGMGPVGAGGTYSLDTANALFHGRSQRISKATATGDYLSFNHAFTYQAGRTYTVSVWVKGENVSGGSSAGDFGIHFDPKLPSGALAVGDITYVAAPTGTFDWTRISLTRTMVSTCPSANLLPIFRNKTGTVWFDGFQVEENAYASPYAGDGPDRLTFDAGKYVNLHQGTIAYWHRPTYDWDDVRGNGILLAMDHPPRLIVFMLIKGREADGRPNLAFNIRRETATQHDWLSAVHAPTGPAWRAGEWHHLAMTWGPGGMALYLDGAAVASNSYSGPVWTDSSAITGAPNLGRLYFAGSGENFSSQSNGALDGLRIWDVQKSAEGIRREYLGIER